MTTPIALGRSVPPPSPQGGGVRKLTDTSTPAHRIYPVDRSKVDPSVIRAAEGMESMFINHMMSAMRQTIPKNDMDLESPASNIYRGMLDSEYAQKAAQVGGIGLADQIIAYLEAQRYTQGRGAGAPGRQEVAKEVQGEVQAKAQGVQGGTDEGQSNRK
ncbi:rod-binding protein [Bdellovibrionota bacterium FG-2]